MSLFKVVKEEGVVIDDVEFQKGELIELESDALNVSDLLAEGSIVETTQEKEEEEKVLTPPVQEADEQPESRSGLYFDGKKLSGEVTEVETDGVLYKTFKTEDGATFKLTPEEFELKVLQEGKVV